MMSGDEVRSRPQGDFRDLVREHRDRVFNFARYTLRHPQDAEDVTQEVLIRLWRHAPRLDGDPRAWVMKVARNACVDSLRRRNTRRAYFAEGDDETLGTAPCLAPDPQADAEASDFRRRLERALEELPAKYREIVVLREIEGLKYDEIAEVTGRPLNSVKVYLHRGRRLLRDALRATARDTAREPGSTRTDADSDSDAPIASNAPEAAHA